MLGSRILQSFAKRKKTMALAVLLLLGLVIQSCASVRGHLDDPGFRSDNLPARTLRVLVASDGSYSRQQIERVLFEGSDLLDKQAGIRIHPVEWIGIGWEKREMVSMLVTLKNACEGYEFDMAIGFTSRTPVEFLVYNLLGDWEGCIDDTWRRFIVLKSTDTRTLLHEIGHGFIFNETHSAYGLMKTLSFRLLPFVPIKFDSLYLTMDNRAEVLRNKWRDFSEIPELVLTREHPIASESRPSVSPRVRNTAE